MGKIYPETSRFFLTLIRLSCERAVPEKENRSTLKSSHYIFSFKSVLNILHHHVKRMLCYMYSLMGDGIRSILPSSQKFASSPPPSRLAHHQDSFLPTKKLFSCYIPTINSFLAIVIETVISLFYLHTFCSSQF